MTPHQSLVVFAAITLTAACKGRPGMSGRADEPLSGPTLIELNLSRGIPEQRRSGLFGPAQGSAHANLVETLRGLDLDQTKGVFVRFGTTPASLSISFEIGNMLGKLRERGLPIVCHADEFSNASYALAARGCSEIWLSPAGQVDTVGIAGQLMFGKGLLDKLQVSVDFLQVGKFKGAQEPYTRNEPSPEARESLESTLRDLRESWISVAGNRSGKNVAPALEDGPHTAHAAKQLGLIDSVGYLDEARDAAKNTTKSVRVEVAFGGARVEQPSVADVLRGLAGGDITTEPHVAVVRASGAITMGGGGAGIFGNSAGITEQGLGRTLHELTENDAVRAVVLRIDSPGGSALASDLLWHRLMKLRKKKPLVVSIGGMAASGGYYLSCAANRIYAEPTSIVGSIGVVGGKFGIGQALRTFGINTVVIPSTPDPQRAARATYMSPFDQWDDATRAKVLLSMEGIYNTFVDRIAEGRGLSREVVEASAEGRIFGGKAAHERKLIDEMGGLSDAIQAALASSGLGSEGRVQLVGAAGNLVDLLATEDEETQETALEQAARSAVRDFGPLSGIGQDFPDEASAWLAGTLGPLTRGETILTTLPFALIVE